MSFLRFLSGFPPHLYLQLAQEENDDGEPFLAASLYVMAPEGGWRNEGERMGTTMARCWSETPHPADVYMPAIRVSVTARDPNTLATLIDGMLERHAGDYDVHPPTLESLQEQERRVQGPGDPIPSLRGAGMSQ